MLLHANNVVLPEHHPHTLQKKRFFNNFVFKKIRNLLLVATKKKDLRSQCMSSSYHIHPHLDIHVYSCHVHTSNTSADGVCSRNGQDRHRRSGELPPQ